MAVKNLAASVHGRLMNRARATTRPFQELLQYYAMERFPAAHQDILELGWRNCNRPEIRPLPGPPDLCGRRDFGEA